MTGLTLAQVRPEHVQAVYSGKPGCACGCRGKHSYPSSMKGLGVQIRGYAIGEEEISDRSVTTILNKVKKLADLAEDCEGKKIGDNPIKGNIVAVETETRLYIVSLRTSH